MGLTRNILIVDDSSDIQQDVKQYYSIFKKIKDEQRLDYNLDIQTEARYERAIARLTSDSEEFDVLLIDYDLSNAGNQKYGNELINEVRSGINKHCKIIFYTMGNIGALFPDRTDLIKLFNMGIYRLIFKDMETSNENEYGPKWLQLRVEAMVDAIKDIDFVQVTLEKFFVKYTNVISNEKITIDGQQYMIPEVIKMIRLDDKVGQIYKQNLTESIILHNLFSGAKK